MVQVESVNVPDITAYPVVTVPSAETVEVAQTIAHNAKNIICIIVSLKFYPKFLN